MDFKTRTLSELARQAPALAAKRCFVGFDGFVDLIVTPVATRTGPGEAFMPFAGIRQFGERIVAASGKSTNIELYARMEKLGGNGPIMANAFAAQGAAVTYVGALGKDRVHPVFADLAVKATTVTLCEPGYTTAVEFPDGKLMLGRMQSLDELTPATIRSVMGDERYSAAIAGADLVALINWTMVPGMTAIFTDLLDRLLPNLPQSKPRQFFFDLCDPEKRATADLLTALALIGRFSAFGRVTLGMNLKEAQQVCVALGLPVPVAEPDSLKAACAAVRERLKLAVAVIHPKESAACADESGTYWVPGPYMIDPLITTGAGDHFSAGFAAAQVTGLTPEACLTAGVCTSGYYVRTAKSPTVQDLQTFLANWPTAT